MKVVIIIVVNEGIDELEHLSELLLCLLQFGAASLVEVLPCEELTLFL